MFVLTLTDDKLLKFVLILGEEERKFELRLFGEKSLAGSEPLLAYYSNGPTHFFAGACLNCALSASTDALFKCTSHADVQMAVAYLVARSLTGRSLKE